MQQVPGILLDTVNVGGNASGSVGGPDFTTKGSGNVTYLVDGATTTDNSYGAFQSGQARQNGGTQPLLRLRHVRPGPGLDGRLASRPADAGHDDQRRDEAGHERHQGVGALPLRVRPLAGHQHPEGSESTRASRRTAPGSSASTAPRSAGRSSRTVSGSGERRPARTSL